MENFHLIYTNADRVDQGVLQSYELDLVNTPDDGTDCDYTLKVDMDQDYLEEGSLFYIEGTEYGGIVDKKTINTEDEEVEYYGRTWAGILQKKVIEPPTGQDYYKVTGNVGNILNLFINLVFKIGDLFTYEKTTLTLASQYQFERYVDAYTGFYDMLITNGYKMMFKYNGSKVVISVAEIVDYSQDEEFDSSQMSFKISNTYHGINHLICLGSGELQNRCVKHLYCDASGNISEDTKTFTGVDELVQKYDYKSASSEDDLLFNGKKKFRELIETESVEIPFDPEDDKYNIGDIVGATVDVAGMTATAHIIKKVLKVKDDEIEISYEVE